jgi:hypothetical protein
MWTLLLTGWNFMRALRLVAGIILIISAIVHRDTLIGGFGIFFTLQGLLNFSSCGMGGCYSSSCGTPSYTRKTNSNEELHAEVIE